MEKYKVTLLRFGQAHILSETKEIAAVKAQSLSENEIVWLSEADGLPGRYLVTLVEAEEEGREESESSIIVSS